jgi:type IV pilus assembly protein PilC
MDKQDKKTTPESLLATFKKRSPKKRREVIYGVYDGRSQPLMTRIDDFMIDHSGIPLQEKAYFFHLLAVMIDAGVPLIQSLQILANRTNNEHFYRILLTVAFNVIQGKKLSEAMARFPEVFGDMEVGVVRAGEAVGNLDKMLFRLSDQLDGMHELQMKVMTASIYPIAVFVVLVLVGSGMLIWVVPNLLKLLKEGGMTDSQLPAATKVLLVLSTALSSFWWLIVVVIVIFYLVFKVYVSSENGKYRWDYLKLKIPVVGSMIRKIMVLRFISTLGILIESGLPVIQALTIIASSLDNEIYRLKIWQVISRVQVGERISAALGDEAFLFPETVTQMLAVAEQSAAIGSVSAKLGLHYDKEIDNSLKRLTGLFEPIMIVIVGLSVALLALAILTPIFSMSQLIT